MSFLPQSGAHLSTNHSKNIGLEMGSPLVSVLGSPGGQFFAQITPIQTKISNFVMTFLDGFFKLKFENSFISEPVEKT